ncbi:MAG: M48 family metallopeptidase [Thermomicrobiales bacterium]
MIWHGARSNEVGWQANVEIPGLDVAKAKRYHRVRLTMTFSGALLGAGELAWFALSGRSSHLQSGLRVRFRSPMAATAAYAAIAAGGSWLVSLPWSFLAGYLIERRFGLTRQSPTAWLGDRSKGLGVSLALETPLIVASYAVIRRRPHDWWLVLSGVAVPVSVVLGNLAPVLIMPLFNRFEPLADDELVRRIRKLADRAGVPIADAFRMDMSRQTEKANAFFTGLGRTKRIVLGDTMLDRYAPEEIEAVVAHELGHQVHGDMWRMIAFGGAAMTGVAYSVGKLTPRILCLTAHRTGVRDVGDEAGLPLVGLVAGMCAVLIAPVSAALSRAMERRTDRYALALTGNGRAYASTMGRLAAQNLSDPSPPRWIVLLLYSHPPIAERIATARAFEALVGTSELARK